MISGTGDAATTGAPLPAAPSSDDLRDLLDRLATQHGAELTEPEIIDHLGLMEQLKSGFAAAQARLTVALVEKRAAAEAGVGVPAEQRGRGLGAEIALARRESPVRGTQHLGLAKALVHELPYTLAALTRGEISEWRAILVARETAVLSKVDRIKVDRELGGQLAVAGDRRVANLARSIGYRLDPGSALRRVRGATGDRRVGLRPAPDTMTYLTGFLPVAQGVACQAALTQEADRKKAAGDPRSRGQIMADTLVERITGQSHATALSVEINLVMTDQALFAGDHAPAHLDGYGPLPASLARALARAADRAWIRRLFTNPSGSELVAIDSRRRLFDRPRRRLLVARDQTCRTPWCDAPIRHADHVTRAADGGATSVINGQGLCEACNHTKETTGWRTTRIPTTRHTVQTTTPTGHSYSGHAPDPPGSLRPRVSKVAASMTFAKSPVEIRIEGLLAKRVTSLRR
ncbi:hypothetical protein ACVW00_001290 [Marmoricola sp. URHA0025 HA25]